MNMLNKKNIIIIIALIIIIGLGLGLGLKSNSNECIYSSACPYYIEDTSIGMYNYYLSKFKQGTLSYNGTNTPGEATLHILRQILGNSISNCKVNKDSIIKFVNIIVQKDNENGYDTSYAQKIANDIISNAKCATPIPNPNLHF